MEKLMQKMQEPRSSCFHSDCCLYRDLSAFQCNNPCNFLFSGFSSAPVLLASD